MLQTNYHYTYQGKNAHNKVNASSNSMSGKMALFYIFLLLLFALILVSYICQSVKITHLNYKVSSLEEELNSIQREVDSLNLKVAREMSVARIETIARNDLKMVEPDKVEFVFLRNRELEEDIYPVPGQREIFLSGSLMIFWKEWVLSGLKNCASTGGL